MGQTVRSSRSEWRCMNQSSEREPRTGEPWARLKPSWDRVRVRVRGRGRVRVLVRLKPSWEGSGA